MSFKKNIANLFRLNFIIEKFKWIYRSYAYKGKEVYCLVCHWNGNQFFHEKCPKCNSLPRNRLMPFSLSYFNIDIEILKILNIGPNKNEYNYIRHHISNIINYDRIDILNYKHVNILQDITKTNLPDQSYDLAIAWHVLEHIPEDVKAIQEVYRLLKPGGHFLVSVPIYPIGNLLTYEDKTIATTDYKTIHGHLDHCRSCGMDYYKRFESVGFHSDTLKVEDLDETIVLKNGLSVHHIVWCFKK